MNYLSIECIDLIGKLFSINADDRITAKDILSHPWL